MGIKIDDMELYSVEELSKLLKIQPRTVRKFIKEGRLRGRKLARRWYVTGESLKAYFMDTEADYPQEEKPSGRR